MISGRLEEKLPEQDFARGSGPKGHVAEFAFPPAPLNEEALQRRNLPSPASTNCGASEPDAIRSGRSAQPYEDLRVRVVV